MTTTQNPILLGLSSLRLAMRREDLHHAALDTLGQTLAFLEQSPQWNIVGPQINLFIRQQLTSPTPPPAPSIPGLSHIGHPAARRVGAEALWDSIMIALYTGQVDLSQSIANLIGIARATCPEASAESMLQHIEEAKRKHVDKQNSESFGAPTRIH